MRKQTRKSLHKKLWDKQSLEMRKGQADFQDYVECFTCRKSVPYKEANVGHFWHNKLDFDKRNLKVQCVKCNHYLRGNLIKYSLRLIEENGLEWVKQLEIDAHQHKGYTFKDLKEMDNKNKSE
jgi:hypothetical protein